MNCGVINIWRQIETLPKNGEPFLAAKSVADGRKSGGVILRASQNPQHEWEQFLRGQWHPAFFKSPKYWMRPEDRDFKRWERF